MPYKDDIHFAVDAGGRDDFLPSAIGGKRGRNNTRQKRKVQAKLAPKRCKRERVSATMSASLLTSQDVGVVVSVQQSICVEANELQETHRQ